MNAFFKKILLPVGLVLLVVFLIKEMVQPPSRSKEKLNELFPELAQLAVGPIEHTAFSDREKVRLQWTRGPLAVKGEFFYPVSEHEVDNLIKQSDLQIFNLFVKQPTPYPGDLTQQTGRDCGDEFLPQVDKTNEETIQFYKVDYLVQKDPTLGACTKEEVFYFIRHVHQYCKEQGILMELSYQLPVTNDNHKKFISSKLTCPKIVDLKDLK